MKTNADKIRAMSDWVLARFLYLVSCNAIKISKCDKECKNCEYSDSYCINEIAEWLLDEAEVE